MKSAWAGGKSSTTILAIEKFWKHTSQALRPPNRRRRWRTRKTSWSSREVIIIANCGDVQRQRQLPEQFCTDEGGRQTERTAGWRWKYFFGQRQRLIKGAAKILSIQVRLSIGNGEEAWLTCCCCCAEQFNWPNWTFRFVLNSGKRWNREERSKFEL